MDAAQLSGLLGGILRKMCGANRKSIADRDGAFGIPQTLVIGELDPIVPRARRSPTGRSPRLEGMWFGPRDRGAGHFELVHPSSRRCRRSRAAVLELLDRSDLSRDPRRTSRRDRAEKVRKAMRVSDDSSPVHLEELFGDQCRDLLIIAGSNHDHEIVLAGHE